MHATSLKIKLTAVFLVAFVCLNAGGAVCVAYCRTAVEAVVASGDHCPLKKKAAARHCDPKPHDPAAAAIGSDKLDCCPMTLGFIGAPIEKRFFSFETVELTLTSPVDLATSFVVDRPGLITLPVYRGPPPLDRRIERIKHRVIRI